MLLAVSVALALALGAAANSRSLQNRDELARRTRCVRGANGLPTKRCEEALRLLAITCAKHPDACLGSFEIAKAQLAPAKRAALDAELRMLLAAP